MVYVAQPSKRILGVFREWKPLASSMNVAESNKAVTDRASRDKIKKIKNLLAEHVPTEQLITLK